MKFVCKFCIKLAIRQKNGAVIIICTVAYCTCRKRSKK